jgi:anti-sigma factor RsiW
MTCRDLTAFLDDYLAGELLPEVRTRFDAHLAICANCARYLMQYRQAIALGRQAFSGDDDLPADVPQALVDAILAARASRSR